MAMIQSSESLRLVGLQGLSNIGGLPGLTRPDRSRRTRINRGIGDVEYYTAPTDTYVLTPPVYVPDVVTPIDYYVAPTDQYTINTPVYTPITIPSTGSSTDWIGGIASSIANLFKPSSATSPQTSQTVQQSQTVATAGTSSTTGQLIPGIPNSYLAIGAGALVLVLVMAKKQ